MKAVNGKIIFDKEDVKLMCRIIIDHAREVTIGPDVETHYSDYIFDNDFYMEYDFDSAIVGAYYEEETYDTPAYSHSGDLIIYDYNFTSFGDEEGNEYTAEQTNIADFYDFINKELYIE